ncbi:MAG: DoxX family protein [Verrucomicrobia bacterium]|nr:DoxX family protein [Verrucomicrobiota bacterium]
MKIAKLLRLDFLPSNTNLALLLLRTWIGATMFILHGWGKVTGFGEMSGKFLNLFGIGSTASLALAIFGEAVCSVLLIFGLFTRLAALCGIITMTVAFTIAHNAVLRGPGSGELAFIYLATYVVLFIAGPGRFSVDAKMGGKV